jgi:hypothetical protein
MFEDWRGAIIFYGFPILHYAISSGGARSDGKAKGYRTWYKSRNFCPIVQGWFSGLVAVCSVIFSALDLGEG